MRRVHTHLRNALELMVFRKYIKIMNIVCSLNAEMAGAHQLEQIVLLITYQYLRGRSGRSYLVILAVKVLFFPTVAIS